MKNIFGNQRNFKKRNGLGFRQYNQRKVNGKQFGYINYFYCNQRGHHIRYCPFRNGTYVLKQIEKLVWVPKAISSKERLIDYTNHIGSKIYWIPYSEV